MSFKQYPVFNTLQELMFVCPTVSKLRFYGCCHPCLFVLGMSMYYLCIFQILKPLEAMRAVCSRGAFTSFYLYDDKFIEEKVTKINYLVMSLIPK